MYIYIHTHTHIIGHQQYILPNTSIYLSIYLYTHTHTHTHIPRLASLLPARGRSRRMSMKPTNLDRRRKSQCPSVLATENHYRKYFCLLFWENEIPRTLSGPEASTLGWPTCIRM